MFEQHFGMEHTPFSRDVPIDRLYESHAMRETLGRLLYVADRQLFAVVTADPGCGSPVGICPRMSILSSTCLTPS